MRLRELNKVFYQQLLIFVLFAVLLPSCTSETDEISISTSSPQAAAETAVPLPTIIPTDTPAPSPTSTPLPVPTEVPTDTPIPPTYTATASPTPLRLAVSSPAFSTGELIPERYARLGDNLSLPLEWSGSPANTESFVVLFVGDPVADGGGTWILWAVYNIPGDINSLSEGLIPDEEGNLQIGGKHLENSYMELAYSGPPTHAIETRRFHVRIYALDKMLSDADIEEATASVDAWIGVTELILFEAMEGHILAEGNLTGKYKGESPVN